MPATRSARQIVELALQDIGQYAPIDTAAAPEHLSRGLDWLDMVVSHVAANRRQFWLVPAEFTVELEEDVAEYDLLTAIGADQPVDGVFAPIEARWRDSSGAVRPVDIWRRQEWDQRPGTSDTGAEPQAIYIERTNAPKLFVYPTPTADATLLLTAQVFTADLTLAGGEASINFRKTWDLYLVTALAARLGAGPITNLPDGEILRRQKEAKALLDELIAFDAQEHADEPRRVAYHDF